MPHSAYLPASWLKRQRSASATSDSTHAHLKQSQSNTTPPLEDTSKPTSVASLTNNYTKPIKVRILTWNMHDSLPKGDLEELFGSIPPYDPFGPKPGTFPLLPRSSNHPYHLVVIAGQECPTPSGIPMGLSANFRILDKEREKLKNDQEDYDKYLTLHNEKIFQDETQKNVNETNDNLVSGWTSMVEGYLCNGNRSLSFPASFSSGESSSSETPKKQKSSKTVRTGPYTLLIKERLMGIYLAIYIHRDLKPFVRGTSKAAVTAGLMGGRVGNKGGVGISLDIDGTTFLFLNAHLAAHEGKIHHRLANLTKIKTELSVDDFLPTGDPRSKAEDLTDRFDFTFLCGDLNFRLDISRLHADWLIARQDFRQAFEFDQLNVLMKKGAFIKGFCEAPIDFPPTFKYDVLRTIKRSKNQESSPTVADNRLDRVPMNTDLEVLEETDDVDEEIEEDSLVSSTKTSDISRPPAKPGNDNEISFFTSAPTPSAIDRNDPSPKRDKARLKWLSVFSPSFFPRPYKPLKDKKGGLEQRASTSSALHSNLSPPLLGQSPKTYGKRTILRPAPLVLLNSDVSEGLPKENESVEEERGVYDSSHKKRVPSWCDRVLWKSTIEAVPIPQESNAEDITPRSMNLVGHFFTNIFRPLSPRTTWDNNTPSGSEASFGGVTTATPRDFVLAQSSSVIPSPPYFRQSTDSRTRRANTSFSPPTTAPALEYPYRRSTAPERKEFNSSGERPQTATHSIWRFLPSFLSPTHNQDYSPQHTQSSSLVVSPLHHKGDVVCLSYNTLDDRGMRRLEGRSDHRPVIGTYIVYA